MKTYKVTVNGNVYEITLEVMDKAQANSSPAPAPTPAPANKAAGETLVKAPMPGTILKASAVVGQVVKKGDILFILEAMKMENEICAPADGTVISVDTQAGNTVESGSVLCSLA